MIAAGERDAAMAQARAVLRENPAQREALALMRQLEELRVRETMAGPARKARQVGNDQGQVKEGQRFVAASAGALFGKSHALSEEVYMAMVSRGYRGDARTLEGFHLAALDFVFIAGCIVASVLTLGGDHLLGH